MYQKEGRKVCGEKWSQKKEGNEVCLLYFTWHYYFVHGIGAYYYYYFVIGKVWLEMKWNARESLIPVTKTLHEDTWVARRPLHALQIDLCGQVLQKMFTIL